LVGQFIPDVFWGRCRPFRELEVAERARARGVPTPEVVAASRTTLFGPFYRGAVYTKELADTRDMHNYLASLTKGLDAAPLRRKRDTVREAGRAVRVAHDAGLCHADLQLRNVLVRHDGTPAVFLVDLDKASWREPLPGRWRIMNLLRLRRSAAKAARSGLCITRTDMVRFLEGYTQVEGADTLRAYWHVPMLKLLYRVKWALSDALSRVAGGSAQKSTV
jgi:tRNA A-37 threonylcarbamoyl transferase component Bud32